MLPGKRSRRREQTLDGRRDFQGLSHAAGTELGLRHGAVIGSDHMNAIGLKHFQIALRCRMQPHVHVHGRCDQDRQCGGEQHRGGEIVRMTARHLRHQVGGGRCNDHKVRIAGKADMADIGLVLTVEEIRMRALPRKRGRGERRDECLSAGRQDTADGGAALAQAADEVERLVGRDAAPDHEKDAFA
jgi:hypothetical protein